MHANREERRDCFFFIPHTHWEGAVFKTREQYLEMGLPHILQALRLLKLYPDYRFVLDQVCYVKPFLERYPEEEASFRQFVEEGRLAIVGGTDVMADVNMPGGESFVRQMLYGKGYFRQELGMEVTTSWQLDSFGHHAQMPQLLGLAGYRSLWFFRGVPDWETSAEFLWEGLDGSQISAFWLAHGYAITYSSPETPEEFAQFMEERFAQLAPFARGPERVGLAGADVCEPEEHVPGLIEEFNRRPDRPFDLKLASPAEYEAVVEERADDLEVVTGELNPIFQGIYSSRIGLKQRTRELERLLTTAEKLGVLLDWQGVESGDLWRAWEPMLFNQAHDLMSGVMTDGVYEDSIRGFDFSRQLAGEEVESRLRGLVSGIDTRGEGMPLVVFNGLGWPRTDLAVAEVGFSEERVVDLELIGPDGQSLPVQILECRRSGDGGLLSARVGFVARDVPALGYSTYRLVARESAGAEVPEAADEEGVLENEYYRLEIDPASGAIERLIVKEGDWEALSGPGNVVAMEEDRGDLWEPYKPLDGGSRIAMKERHPAPGPGEATFSNGQDGVRGSTMRGPAVSEFSVELPFGEKGRVATTIRLYAGLRRIELCTRILNEERFVRYRLLFPTAIQGGESVHEIPFGAIGRPDGVEFPAQNWIDYGDGERGIALLNRGLPGNNVADGTMMLSLMRSTSIVAYGFGGGYEPGMSSDSGYEEGKEQSFECALVPHAGDWRRAGTYREGMEFNHPLLVRTAASGPGALPANQSFLKVSPENVVVSTLKPGENGGAVVRIYEAAGLPVEGARIEPAGEIAAAAEVDLMEDEIGELPVVGGGLSLDLRPFEIKTIRFELEPL